MDIDTFNKVASQLDTNQLALYMKALHIAPSDFRNATADYIKKLAEKYTNENNEIDFDKFYKDYP